MRGRFVVLTAAEIGGAACGDGKGGVVGGNAYDQPFLEGRHVRQRGGR